MPQIEKFGKESATTTLTSAPGSSSRARSAALIPASLPPIISRCMTDSPPVGWSMRLARCRSPARQGGTVVWGARGGLVVVGDDDVRGLTGSEVRVQRPRHRDGEPAADHLGGDERRG